MSRTHKATPYTTFRKPRHKNYKISELNAYEEIKEEGYSASPRLQIRANVDSKIIPTNREDLHFSTKY